MGTRVIARRHDPTVFTSYTPSAVDTDYYPTGGPLVAQAIHTARVEAHDLDALELSSGGDRIVLTTNGDKALEVRALGVADPAVVDTTVLDAGDNALKLESTAGVLFASDNVSFTANEQFRAGVTATDAATPTSHFVATQDSTVLGVGVLDASDTVLSGGFLTVDEASFQLRTDSASITGSAGASAGVRYDAAHSHEFFAGAGAKDAAAGSGAVQILSDKVIIRRNVDVVGTIDAVGKDEASLRVADRVIQLAHSDDADTAHRDTLLATGKAGLVIDTVPGSYEEDGEYVGRFTDAAGAKLFVHDDSATIDVSRARESGLFAKEVAYHLNGGMRQAGMRTDESRANEPYWNVAGGALRISHTVPDGAGRAKTLAFGLRVTDAGTLEFVRISTFLVWDDAAETFVRDPERDVDAQVVVKYVDA